MKKIIICLLIGLVLILNGCKSQTCVIASTGTVIGLEAIYDQATQTPKGRLGYVRAELAIVPTNRTADDQIHSANQGNGASDSTDVLIEFDFWNFFSFWDDHGIRQKIAIGRYAINSDASILMLAKDRNGNVNVDVLRALKETQSYSDDRDILALLKDLGNIYKGSINKSAINKDIKKLLGIETYDDLTDTDPKKINKNKLKKIIDKYK